MSDLGIGVIGAGMAALTGHLPAIRRVPGCRLVALCDVVEEQLELAAAVHSPAHTFVSPHELLDLEDVDAVVVATPPPTHGDLVLGAIEAGKHVLCEKPLARSAAECGTIVRRAEEGRVILAVGHEKRFSPTLRRVGELLASGEIGTPFYAGMHWASNAKLAPDHLIPPGFERGYRWRWEDPAVGGGLLQDHLPHYVDLFRHWLRKEPDSVFAMPRNIARDELGWDPTSSRWDDFALVVVQFDGGFVLRFETTVVGRSLSPLLGLGSGDGEWTEYAYVLGTDGQLLYDLFPWDSSENGRIASWRLERAVEERSGWTYVEQREPRRLVGAPAGAAAEMFDAQLAAWLDAIRGETSTVATGHDGLVCVAAVDAAYRSAETGSLMPVNRAEVTT